MSRRHVAVVDHRQTVALCTKISRTSPKSSQELCPKTLHNSLSSRVGHLEGFLFRRNNNSARWLEPAKGSRCEGGGWTLQSRTYPPPPLCVKPCPHSATPGSLAAVRQHAVGLADVLELRLHRRLLVVVLLCLAVRVRAGPWVKGGRGGSSWNAAAMGRTKLEPNQEKRGGVRQRSGMGILLHGISHCALHRAHRMKREVEKWILLGEFKICGKFCISRAVS